MASAGRYVATRKRPSLPLIAAIVLLHVAALYGLARALAPDVTAAATREVVSAFSVTITIPPDPPPPPAEEEPDPGAEGDPGRAAVAQPVTRPPAPVELRQDAAQPRVSSTGTADRSGAAQAGAGTGAAGTGPGTGSGNRGSGRGAGAVSRPVHISGTIDNARDFPPPEGGRQARQGTEVIVRVTVGTDGRARNCTVYRPSPDPEADRITCRLVEERLGFHPARDAEGNPVAAPFYWRQRWF